MRRLLHDGGATRRPRRSRPPGARMRTRPAARQSAQRSCRPRSPGGCRRGPARPPSRPPEGKRCSSRARSCAPRDALIAAPSGERAHLRERSGVAEARDRKLGNRGGELGRALEPGAVAPEARQVDLPPARVEPPDQFGHLALCASWLEVVDGDRNRQRSGERHDAHLSKRGATPVSFADVPHFRFSRLHCGARGKCISQKWSFDGLCAVEVTVDRNRQLVGMHEIGAALDMEQLVAGLPQQSGDRSDVREFAVRRQRRESRCRAAGACVRAAASCLPGHRARDLRRRASRSRVPVRRSRSGDRAYPRARRSSSRPFPGGSGRRYASRSSRERSHRPGRRVRHDPASTPAQSAGGARSKSIEPHVLGDLLEIAWIRFEGDDLSARADAPGEEQREDALVAADVEDGQPTERQRFEKALLRAFRAELRDESEAAASRSPLARPFLTV